MKNNKGKKPSYAHVKNLNFPYGNPDWAASQLLETQENSPHTPLSKSVYSRHSVLLVQYFSLMVSLPTLPFTLQQINIAWPMMWSTLHVNLYRKALCITTVGDQIRERERVL